MRCVRRVGSHGEASAVATIALDVDPAAPADGAPADGAPADGAHAGGAPADGERDECLVRVCLVDRWGIPVFGSATVTLSGRETAAVVPLGALSAGRYLCYVLATTREGRFEADPVEVDVT